ncbi:hypothetical protein QEH52_19440 [Coraliomargarita sp. SDUM461003]|uniref:Uncharacterized protein n=1 Tax=Thalassobacterium maritimum TaxID=3041265 RepID=A0ABU1AZW4_9BACT|nr:hypothetical protein [Coraliomargarita sp. SDUM461003]MDQ8209701.1 hypothetical protein [Coraliomargarita sp. SDUM461003]
MSTRKIFIEGNGHYDFKPLSHYEEKWSFLHDYRRKKIIAQKLSYLEFHRHLLNKIKHTNLVEGSLDMSIDFDLSVGFIQTDILLIGSICEGALYSQLRHRYDRGSRTTKKSVQDCFEVKEKKFESLSNQEFKKEGSDTSFKIGCYRTETKQLQEYAVSFSNLLKVAKSISLISSDCFGRLDLLRKSRNTIHSGEEARRQSDERFVFSVADREEALETMVIFGDPKSNFK